MKILTSGIKPWEYDIELVASATTDSRINGIKIQGITTSAMFVSANKEYQMRHWNLCGTTYIQYFYSSTLIPHIHI